MSKHFRTIIRIIKEENLPTDNIILYQENINDNNFIKLVNIINEKKCNINILDVTENNITDKGLDAIHCININILRISDNNKITSIGLENFLNKKNIYIDRILYYNASEELIKKFPDIIFEKKYNWVRDYAIDTDILSAQIRLVTIYNMDKSKKLYLY